MADDRREHFQRTFGTLFEGGVADIRLAGDEDPLHAPIEIMARPKGKRLNSIHLLSSGERALTAVAFLFAIYLVKVITHWSIYRLADIEVFMKVLERGELDLTQNLGMAAAVAPRRLR